MAECVLLAPPAADLELGEGQTYLLGFAFQSPYPNAPRAVHQDELRALFDPERGWQVLALRAARLQTRSPLGDMAATAACVERT